MKNKTLIVLLTILILTCAVFSASAERELSGDKLDFVPVGEGYSFTAVGNVELIYDDITLRSAGRGSYDQTTGDIRFEDEVELFYLDYEAYAGLLYGNINKEVFHLRENPEILGPESHLKGDEIDVYRAEQKIEIRKNAYLDYQNLQANSEKIDYFMDREIIILDGNVEGTRNGQKFSAEKVTVDLAEEKVNMEGQATVVFPQEEESDGS